MIQIFIVYESDHFLTAANCIRKGQDTMQGAHRSQRHRGLQRATGRLDAVCFKTGLSDGVPSCVAPTQAGIVTGNHSAFYQCIPVRDRFLCFLQRQQIGNTNKPEDKKPKRLKLIRRRGIRFIYLKFFYFQLYILQSFTKKSLFSNACR